MKRRVYASAPGLLRSVTGLDDAASAPGVVRVATFAVSGDLACGPDSHCSEVAHVICEADTTGEASRFADQATAAITVVTDPADPTPVDMTTDMTAALAEG